MDFYDIITHLNDVFLWLKLVVIWIKFVADVFPHFFFQHIFLEIAKKDLELVYLSHSACLIEIVQKCRCIKRVLTNIIIDE